MKVMVPEYSAEPERGCSRVKSFGKKLWAYLGPGFLVAIAYVDPGNCMLYQISWLASNGL